jgi:hypothetical protein
MHNDLLLCPFTVIVDQQEKIPYTFAAIPPRAERENRMMAVRTEEAHLETADYSIRGLEDHVAVERKSLSDLYTTLGQGRERFEREIARLQEMPCGNVMIEADWREMIRPDEPAVIERRAIEILERAIWEEEAAGEDRCEGCDLAKAMLASLESWLAGRWQRLPARSDWRSMLNPRSVWGTIFSWAQRYPRVHWWTLGSRRLAEMATFEILERFWREQ